MTIALMYWKQILFVLALAGVSFAVWSHFDDDRDTRIALEAAIAEVYATKAELSAVQEAFKAATQAKDELDAKVIASEIERSRIQATLAETLQRMRAKKAPTTCNEAIIWSVNNKDDLKW